MVQHKPRVISVGAYHKSALVPSRPPACNRRTDGQMITAGPRAALAQHRGGKMQ